MHGCHQNRRSGLGESFSACGEESSNVHRSYPLCPKPRRIQPSPMPDFLNPLPCSKHRSDKKPGILTLIADNNNKKGAGECISSRERSEVCSCSCCWSCCYSGSPPGRTENPLVQDVRFIKEQMDLISHLSDQFAFASTASATHV